MLVDTLVSSINARRLGSSLICILNHALRAAATSGRSCSAACRLFFKGEVEMTKEAEDGSLTDRHVTLCQASLQFGEGEIGLSVHPSLDLTPVRLKSVPFVAAKFLRTNAPGPSPSREKSTDTTDAYAAQISSFLIRVTRLNRLNDAASQVIRVWLRHSCWPLSGGKLESQRPIRGNPGATQPFRKML